MKQFLLIFTILLSSAVFSQDFIEYNDFTFSQNRKEIQMEDIKKLTNRYNVGEWNLRKAKKYLRLTQKSNLGFIRNSFNFLGGSATVFVSFGAFVIGADFLTDDGPGFLEFYHPPTGSALIAFGAVSGSTAIYLFSNIGSRQVFELRANKQFKKVAEKLNQAISDERSSAEPSNYYDPYEF